MTPEAAAVHAALEHLADTMSALAESRAATGAEWADACDEACIIAAQHITHADHLDARTEALAVHLSDLRYWTKRVWR